jgi:glycosyltransferase involved in cell wall biosynthesis
LAAIKTAQAENTYTIPFTDEKVNGAWWLAAANGILITMSTSYLFPLLAVVLIFVELSLYYFKFTWDHRRIIASLNIVLGFIVACLLISQASLLTGGLIGLTFLYKIANLLRILENRMDERYLKRATLRTSWLLNMMLICWLGLSATGALHVISWNELGLVQFAAALFLMISTLVNIRRSSYQEAVGATPAKDLPTVTVAIPARNETSDLMECLDSVLASTYPKLEVLVLDDSSQINISDIVKKFAHDGVRFIHGDQPRDTWLPKNQAYDTLAQAAEGDFVLFCGVDVRFGPDTINQLVRYAQINNLAMVSALPQRTYQGQPQVLQPMRYWWELALPRFWMKQPPSISTCWLINRKVMNKLGNFGAVRRRIRPETYFARETHRRRQYSFIRSTNQLALITVKDTRSQFDTAIRLRYPDVHKRPERVMLVTAYELALFVLPFLQILAGLLTRNTALVLLSLVTTLLLLGVQIAINLSCHIQSLLMTYVSLPVVILAEIYVLNESMRRYEFGSVDWRGRNIVGPVMHNNTSI